MKVNTNVKGGGGCGSCGLLGGIDVAVVLVVDINLFGGGCKKRC